MAVLLNAIFQGTICQRGILCQMEINSFTDLQKGPIHSHSPFIYIA